MFDDKVLRLFSELSSLPNIIVRLSTDAKPTMAVFEDLLYLKDTRRFFVYDGYNYNCLSDDELYSFLKQKDAIDNVVTSSDSYGLPNDGITDIYATFATKLAEIGSEATEIVLKKGTYLLANNLNVPTNIKLVFENGAKFYVNESVTLSLNCEIDAGLHQIFDGPGTINGTIKNEIVFPQWWGAVANANYLYSVDGEYYTSSAHTVLANDDTTAFQKAIDFCHNTYKTVYFPKLSDPYLIKYLGVKQGVNLESNYATLCAKKLSAEDIAIYPGFIYLAEVGQITFVRYHNFLVEGHDDNLNQNCLHFKALHQDISAWTGGIWYSKFDTIRINDFAGKAIYLYCNDRDGYNNGVACTADNTTDTFTKTAHGLVNNMEVHFEATTFPSDMTLGTRYYVIGATANTFQISTSVGGSAVNFTTDGTGLIYYISQIAKSCTVDSTTDVITRNSHAYVDGDTVQFSATSLPTNLVAGTTYYVRDKTANTFKVSSTSGGTAIDIGSNGTAVYVFKTSGQLNADMANQFLDFEKITVFRNANNAYCLYVEGQLGQTIFTSCEFDARPGLASKPTGPSVWIKPIIGGNSTDTSIQYVEFDNCTFQQAETCIYAYNVNNLIIKNCWFESSTLGMDLASATNAVVTGTYFGNVGSNSGSGYAINVGSTSRLTHGFNNVTGSYDYYIIGSSNNKGIVSLGNNSFTDTKMKNGSPAVTTDGTTLTAYNSKIVYIDVSGGNKAFKNLSSQLADGEEMTVVVYGGATDNTLVVTGTTASGNIYLPAGVASITLTGRSTVGLDTITLKRLQIQGITSVRYVVVSHTGIEA